MSTALPVECRCIRLGHDYTLCLGGVWRYNF